jgi:hypothetical protein
MVAVSFISCIHPVMGVVEMEKSEIIRLIKQKFLEFDSIIVNTPREGSANLMMILLLEGRKAGLIDAANALGISNEEMGIYIEDGKIKFK